MDQKVKGVPDTPHYPPLLWRGCPLSAQGETPSLVPSLTWSKARPLRAWGFKVAVSRPPAPP